VPSSISRRPSTPVSSTQAYAPGARVRVRDEEWVVRLAARVVAAVKAHMARLRKERAEALRPRLIAQRDAIEAFRGRSLEQLQRREQSILESGRKLRTDEAQRLARTRHQLLALVEARNRWLLQRVETDERAYVRIAAVLVGA